MTHRNWRGRSGTKTKVQEFDILDDDANIYKQIGPVLLKQDKTDAVMAVNGRLEFINKEMCVQYLWAGMESKVDIWQLADREANPGHSGQERKGQDGCKDDTSNIKMESILTHHQIMQIQSAAQQSQDTAAA